MICTCYRIGATSWTISISCQLHGQEKRARVRGRLARIDKHMRQRRWVSKVLGNTNFLCREQFRKGPIDRNAAALIEEHPGIDREMVGRTLNTEWTYLRMVEEEHGRLAEAS